MKDYRNVIERIKSSVLATDPGATLILFGSHARGENTIESDIDILVLLDKDKISVEDRKRIGYPLYDIQLESEILISPAIFSRKLWETKLKISPFYKNVTQEGKIL